MSDSQTPEQLKQPMQQQQQQNRQPLKRQLPFSTKPPFMASGGDYHRFASTEPRRVADHEAEAIVVKSPYVMQPSLSRSWRRLAPLASGSPL